MDNINSFVIDIGQSPYAAFAGLILAALPAIWVILTATFKFSRLCSGVLQSGWKYSIRKWIMKIAIEARHVIENNKYGLFIAKPLGFIVISSFATIFYIIFISCLLLLIHEKLNSTIIFTVGSVSLMQFLIIGYQLIRTLWVSQATVRLRKK